MKYNMGKLPWDTLARALRHLPMQDPDLVMGPGVGEDAAVIRFSNGFLVMHTDPITTATRRIGWYAVNIAANDIAVRGAKPRWFLATILLPPGISDEEIDEIFKDMGEAAKELNGVVIGGHTEVTPGLDRPIITVTAIGYSPDRVVLTRDARPGDKIIVVGRIGGEGASIIAHDYRDKLIGMGIDRRIIEEAEKYIDEISVVDKALLLKRLGVNSMHDPTEGGLIQAVRELALASGSEADIYIDRINIDPIVEEITGALGIDPLRLLSSGTIIATIHPDRVDEVVEELRRNNIEYSIIGEITVGEYPGRTRIHYSDGRIEVIDRDVIDEIYKLFS